MRIRSGIILIEDHALALIERHRAGRHYFIPPGGGVDNGESLEDAAIRETKEELGLQVAIKQLVAEINFKGRLQYYFLVKRISGEFGTGTGDEYGAYNPVHGTYKPIWMPLTDLLERNTLPRVLMELIVGSTKNGWSNEPAKLLDKAE